MLICVDIDNTLAATNLELVRAFNINLNTYPSPGILPDFFISEEGKKLLWRTEPFPFAVTALYRLYRAGYQFEYISSRAPEHYFLTKRWLETWNFPEGNVNVGLSIGEKVDFVGNKNAVGCFEDDPAVAIGLIEKGIPVWLKDWPYNEGLYGEGILRFKSWVEIARSIIPVAGLGEEK